MKKYKNIILEISFLFIFIISILLIYFLTSQDIYIKLNGKDDITLNIYEKYNDNGVKIQYCSKFFKTKCKDISNEVIVNSNVNSDNIGKYTVSYEVDYKGIKKNIVRNIIVKDTEAPIITLNTSDYKYTCPNKEYVEEGYTVTDNYDTDLKDKVIIKKDIKGWTYTVSDSAGNKASAYRKFEYDDSIKPSISLKGGNYIYIKLNNTYNELGYTASDNCDGDITINVNINGEVNTSKEGLYKVTYSVTDNKGNTSSVIRTIKVYSEENASNIIYLTFDDGPCVNTKRLLNLLDEYNIKATFFTTYQFGDKYINYIKEAYEKGHSIGLHTASHVFKNIYSSSDAYFNDLSIIDEVVYKKTGIHSKLIRFPGGSSNTVSRFNKGIMTELAKEVTEKGYVYFDWNVESNDTGTSNSNTIANNIISGIQNHKYSVVLQHDLYTYSIDSLRKVIEYGINNGYTFLPLTEGSPTAHHGINN